MPPTNPSGDDGGGFDFLGLPPELRDSIYKLLLDFESPPPRDPAKVPERHAMYPEDGSFPTNIMITQRLPPISCGGLMCSNRQIFNELSHAISRSDITYKLDLMFKTTREPGTQDNDFSTVICYPTWTKRPASLSHIKFLDVNIRLNSWTKLTRPGINIMPVARVLLHLLGRGFLYGPGFAPPSSSPRKRFFVQEMRVNVDENYTDEISIFMSSIYETTFARLPRFLERIASAGVLSGKLGAISAYWHGEFGDRWDVEPSRALKSKNVAREWARPEWKPRGSRWIPRLY
ncbi:MAG: hypothetical protein Q9168_003735 [Polycauliona sp. 1 TL-2023]